MKRLLLSCCALIPLAACTLYYDVPTSSLLTTSALQTDQAPVAGKYAVLIRTDQTNTTLPNSTYTCSPTALRVTGEQDYQNLIKATLDQVLEVVEQVPSSMTQDQLATQGYAGFISVEINRLGMHLTTGSVFQWQVDIYTDMTLEAELSITPTKGQTVTKSLSRKALGKAKEGGGCNGSTLAALLGLERASKSLMQDMENQVRATLQ